MNATRKCAVEECERNVRAQQLCSMHYKRAWRSGLALPLPDPLREEHIRPRVGNSKKRGICSITACLKPHRSLGFCEAHYQQFVRTGDPIAGVVLPGEERFNARFEKKDSGCWEWTGYTSSNGYGKISIDAHEWAAHRWSYVSAFGKISDGLVVDHLCYNKICVNPDHLRTATIAENNLNLPVLIAGAQAGPGVHELPGGKYAAILEVKGFPVTIGKFDSKDEAELRLADADGARDGLR